MPINHLRIDTKNSRKILLHNEKSLKNGKIIDLFNLFDINMSNITNIF